MRVQQKCCVQAHITAQKDAIVSKLRCDVLCAQDLQAAHESGAPVTPVMLLCMMIAHLVHQKLRGLVQDQSNTALV